MRFVSTGGRAPLVGFLEAIGEGLAPDGGLYVPERYPRLDGGILRKLKGQSLHALALHVLWPFMEGELESGVLERIIEEAFTFDAVLRPLDLTVATLELFHGPTLAFKDFGVRFMAKLLEFTNAPPATILTATSGDTGSAVASAFHGIEHFRVVVLYPKGKISQFQEQQIASLGGNVTAASVEGSFDDCQRLVKQAFRDRNLRARTRLCSANSINLARLLPQVSYYFRAAAQLDGNAKAVFSVPSGNFGNVAAGLIAKRMGLPSERFIAATNVNDVVPRFLSGGAYEPRPAIETLSNAMDIADPSNFTRILSLYGGNVESLRADLSGQTCTDEETLSAMRELFEKTAYVADPHGAVAYRGLTRSLRNGESGIFLETAHPMKFQPSIEAALGQSYAIPSEFDSLMKRPKFAVEIMPSYEDLIELLI